MKAPTYDQLLESKSPAAIVQGISIEGIDLNSAMFPHQKLCVEVALQRGKCALFEDVGLGKTLQACEWAKQISSEGTGMMLAPLAVAHQFIREGKKFEVDINLCESQSDVKKGINITNYEKLHKFDQSFPWCFVVADESSILKNFSGKHSKQLRQFVKPIPYRLACTATPAPNDLIELVTHAEFLEVGNFQEIRAMYFTQDGNSSSKYRLMNYARKAWWEYVASWAIALTKPSDLGFDDTGYNLPPIQHHYHCVDALFTLESLQAKGGFSEQRKQRKLTIEDRVSALAKMVNESDEEWLIWCHLNPEGDLLEKLIPDAVQVAGRHTDSQKEDRMIGFSEGKHRVLISKTGICGFGMNWQHCRNVAFVGVDDSWEKLHQGIGRVHRFGQQREVNVHYFHTWQDQKTLSNLQRKAQQSEEMKRELIAAMRQSNGFELKPRSSYAPSTPITLPNWIKAS